MQMRVGATGGVSPQVAHAAAVLGDRFTVGDLETVGRLPAQAVADGVDLLVDAQVLQSSPDGRLRFRDQVTRQTIYNGAGVAWLRGAHRRAAEMLRERGEAEHVWAEHVRRCAEPGDLVAVRHLSRAAGSVRLNSAQAAARWYEAAFALLPQNAGTRARRGRLLLSQAAALTATGQLIAGRDAAEGALALLPQRGWRVRRQALLLSAHIEQAIGRYDEAAALLRRAASLHPGPDTMTSAIRVQLAGTHVMKGDFDLARRTAELILHQRAPVDHWEQAAATGIIALAFYVSGDAAQAIAYADEMGALIDSSTDRELMPLLSSMGWLGWTDMFLGRYEHAQRRLGRAAQLARGSRQQHVLINLLIGRGGALRYLGRLADSRECYQEAHEAARVSGSDVLVVATLAMLCRIHTWLGDHDVALDYGQQSVALARRASGWFTAIAPAVLAQAKLEAGDSRGCVEAVLAATGGPELPRIDLGSRPDWYELLTRAAVLDGELEEASGWAKRGKEAAYQLEVPGNAGFAWLADAHVALAEGDPRQAHAHAMTAVTHFDRCDNRLDSLRAKLVAGQALAAMGKREPAAQLLRRTAGEATAYGAAAIARRCVLPPAAAPRAQLPLGTLTGREREVAELVAAGCTNRQIAEKLFLSIKTVERHLARIFGKLEITTRAKLAAMVAAQVSA